MTIQTSDKLAEAEYMSKCEDLLKDFACIHDLELRKRNEFYQFLLPNTRSLWQRIRYGTPNSQICSVVLYPLMYCIGRKPGWMKIRIRVFGEKFSELVKWDLLQPLELTESLLPVNVKFDLTFELESRTPVEEDKRTSGLITYWSREKRGKVI